MLLFIYRDALTSNSFDLRVYRSQLDNRTKHTLIQGNSCKIGNTRLLGTSKNQNHQLCEICHFCLIFTLQQYIVAQKLIGQPYCSFNQHFVACQRIFSVPRRRRQNIQRIWPGKSVHSAQIKCKRHHLMLKSISRSIYVLFFSFSSGTCSIKLCLEEIKKLDKYRH